MDATTEIPFAESQPKDRAKPQRARRKLPRRRAPENESARDRFVRIGQHRMVNVLKGIRLLGNLSADGYDFEPKDVEVMRQTINEQLDKSFGRFILGEDKQTRLENVFHLRAA